MNYILDSVTNGCQACAINTYADPITSTCVACALSNCLACQAIDLCQICDYSSSYALDANLQCVYCDPLINTFINMSSPTY